MEFPVESWGNEENEKRMEMENERECVRLRERVEIRKGGPAIGR